LESHSLSGPETEGAEERPSEEPASLRRTALWLLALAGQSVFIFAVLALSSPGRIDIIDAQTRYEVARSLVDHGDHVVRDRGAYYAVLEGRGGERYTNYRFPHSGLGVLAILAADSAGSVSEIRRQFYFSLISPVCAALLALTYSVWFRHLGHSPAASLGWSAAGILCTPNWYYGTSTFDEMLGTIAIVPAVAIAWMCRDKRPLIGAALAGLVMAWAINCKPPLGIFVLPVLAAVYRPGRTWRQQAAPLGLVLAGICLGVLAYKVYDWYKFPPEASEVYEAQLKLFGDVWTGNPFPALANFALSPSAGVFWYCPTLVLTICGWRRWRLTYPRFCKATLIASGVFVLFICYLTFFKGEPTWGPRYLTPVYALGWVFVPAAAEVLWGLVVGLLLGLGVVVQLLGLSMDPQRLFLEAPLPFNYYYDDPWFGFHPAASHLLQRPREIIRAVSSLDEKSPRYGPGPVPTHAGALLHTEYICIASMVSLMASPQETPAGIALVWDYRAGSTARFGKIYHDSARRYQIFNSFRPWWASQCYLSEEERPVDIGRTLELLIIVCGLGLVLMVLACRNLLLENARTTKSGK
jgi:hypothetical protein